jgi:hypothetical protein
MLSCFPRRRSQVAKAGVCKTPIAGSNPAVASNLRSPDDEADSLGEFAINLCLPIPPKMTRCMGRWRNGRRCGLKIRWTVMSVRVRLPPAPPALKGLQTFRALFLIKLLILQMLLVSHGKDMGAITLSQEEQVFGIHWL